VFSATIVLASSFEGKYQSVMPPAVKALAVTAGPLVHTPTMAMVFLYPLPMAVPLAPVIDVFVFEHQLLASLTAGALSR